MEGREGIRKGRGKVGDKEGGRGKKREGKGREGDMGGSLLSKTKWHVFMAHGVVRKLSMQEI